MNRIALLRKEKNMSQVSLALALNVSQKMISAYENGKSEPGVATLKSMAEIFNTSVDYIIGYTDIRSPIDKIAQGNFSPEEYNLISNFRQLSPKQQNIALGIILGLKYSEKQVLY